MDLVDDARRSASAHLARRLVGLELHEVLFAGDERIHLGFGSGRQTLRLVVDPDVAPAETAMLALLELVHIHGQVSDVEMTADDDLRLLIAGTTIRFADPGTTIDTPFWTLGFTDVGPAAHASWRNGCDFTPDEAPGVPPAHRLLDACARQGHAVVGSTVETAAGVVELALESPDPRWPVARLLDRADSLRRVGREPVAVSGYWGEDEMTTLRAAGWWYFSPTGDVHLPFPVDHHAETAAVLPSWFPERERIEELAATGAPVRVIAARDRMLGFQGASFGRWPSLCAAIVAEKARLSGDGTLWASSFSPACPMSPEARTRLDDVGRWPELRIAAAMGVLRAWAAQPAVAAALAETGNDILVAAGADAYWTAGETEEALASSSRTGHGRNLFGFALMALRAELG